MSQCLKREWAHLIACDKGDKEYAKSHKLVDANLEKEKKELEENASGFKFLSYSTVVFTVIFLSGANVFTWFYLQIICLLGAGFFSLLGVYLAAKSATYGKALAKVVAEQERQYDTALSHENVVPRVKYLMHECLEKMALKPVLAWEQKKIGDYPDCPKEFNQKAFEVHELLTRAQLSDFELVAEVLEYQIVEKGSDLISLLGLSKDFKSQELLQLLEALRPLGEKALLGLSYWKKTRFENFQIFLLVKCGSRNAVIADFAVNQQ